MRDPKKIGDIGEKIASGYLKEMGYEIIERNYGGKFSSGILGGEIDIIARKNGFIHFVEVKSSLSKTPFSENDFPPEARVNRAKEKRLIKTAFLWLARRKIALDSKWQIDILSLLFDPATKKAKLRHFPNAITLQS